MFLKPSLFTRLDYCGISLLIAGSIVPCLYYGFYCHFYSKIIYIFATLVLCAASLIVSFFDKFSESQYRPVRAGVFTAFALSSVIPAVHWYVTHGGVAHLGTTFQSAVFFILLMATLYITGVLFYALRIPERFYPGKFDLYVSFNWHLFGSYLTTLSIFTVSLTHSVSHIRICRCHFPSVWSHVNGWHSPVLWTSFQVRVVEFLVCQVSRLQLTTTAVFYWRQSNAKEAHSNTHSHQIDNIYSHHINITIKSTNLLPQVNVAEEFTFASSWFTSFIVCALFQS